MPLSNYQSFIYSVSRTNPKVSELHGRKDASGTEFKGICYRSTLLLYRQCFWEN
ncbi:hypothetical protein [Nostoc sp.]|uniref:hypothetical protein n=1 Tax=Nostoc sp. TaxID=1180 RepID=UPI002FFBFE6B